MTRMPKPSTDIIERLLVFPSDLGWMAVTMAGGAVRRLTFGHRSRAAAMKGIATSFGDCLSFRIFGVRRFIAAFLTLGGWCEMISFLPRKAAINRLTPKTFTVTAVERNLVARLQDYAAGKLDASGDMGDISVDFGPASEFRRRVLTLCRRIPCGRTMSYAELAARAGSPRAARAVGNCMATNPIPLLIPCHRVICADGRIGVYSAPGGAATKQRLWAMERDAMGSDRDWRLAGIDIQ
jgi:O-6-methylguanine DNA methyltransferase